MKYFNIRKSLLSTLLTVGGIILLQARDSPQTLDLSGEWQVALDKEAIGLEQSWHKGKLLESQQVILPGSLDENGIGIPITEKSDAHLGKPLEFEGAAWYARRIDVPSEFEGSQMELLMERTKVTQVWVNGQSAGGSDMVYSPQSIDLTKLIRTGEENLIVICVNNDPSLVPVTGSHAYSENTQTNWNGIIGNFAIVAKNKQHVETLRVTPNVNNHSFEIELTLPKKVSATDPIELVLSATQRGPLPNSPQCKSEKSITISTLEAGEAFKAVLSLDSNFRPWSDLDPAIAQLSVNLLQGGKAIDQRDLTVGLRAFESTPDGFTINAQKTFLRGKHDACVFPITAYPPMDVEGWLRVMGISKTYGINHYRFHTFTPPAAAFEAADRLGIYIQTELPIWWGFDGSETQEQWLTKQGLEILDAYGNHPSFVMMAMGNEIGGRRENLRRMVARLREHDPRPLYAQGSNNDLGNPSAGEEDDFFTAMRTGEYQPDGSTDARMSISHMDSKNEGGALNFRYPSTTINFDKAMERSPVPFLGFEVGQYQVFPNFSELSKYTGVLKPYNLEIYRDNTINAGLIDQAEDFFLASGALSVLGYRADIEAMIRTHRYSGFELLDLQDYPGQDTALVGMLDAFMDSKGLIRADQWRQFCDSVIILLKQEKFCWTDAETYSAEVDLANYDTQSFENGSISWELRDGRHILADGAVAIDSPAASGLVTAQQKIEIPLKEVVGSVPARLDIDLFLNGSKVKNSYAIWVYPAEETILTPSNVTVTDSLDANAKETLDHGGRVLLFPKPEAIMEHSTGNQFISEFWNWRMFTSLAVRFDKPERSPGTLGLLVSERHPALADFPTSFHTDYQWWPIVTGSRALILDDLPQDYRPIVQVIDNISRLHKLGMLCEFKVGKGSLLVCTSRLPDHLQYPEVRQFYRSLLNYAASDQFTPNQSVAIEDLKAMGL